MNLQDFDKTRFDECANNIRIWRSKAEDLHTSAIVLRDKFLEYGDKFDPENNLAESVEILKYLGLPEQSAMLLGFAVEAYLKAFWLAKGNVLAKEGEYRLEPLKRDNHRLDNIAQAVGFAISDTEKEVLGRLSLFATSYGRYPVTKAWHNNPYTENEDGVLFRLSWSNEDHDCTLEVFGRLRTAVDESIQRLQPEDPEKPGNSSFEIQRST